MREQCEVCKCCDWSCERGNGISPASPKLPPAWWKWHLDPFWFCDQIAFFTVELSSEREKPQNQPAQARVTSCDPTVADAHKSWAQKRSSVWFWEGKVVARKGGLVQKQYNVKKSFWLIIALFALGLLLYGRSICLFKFFLSPLETQYLMKTTECVRVKSVVW